MNVLRLNWRIWRGVAKLVGLPRRGGANGASRRLLKSIESPVVNRYRRGPNYLRDCQSAATRQAIFVPGVTDFLKMIQRSSREYERNMSRKGLK